MLSLLTFNDDKYAQQNARLVATARKLKLFDRYISYSPTLLEKHFPAFVKEHSSILTQPRGAGYWLWKPFLILKMLEKYGPGTQVWYMDSGDLIRSANFRTALLNHFKVSDICLSYSSQPINKKYTKRDCFYYMECDEEKYWNAPHVEAGGCGFQYSINSRAFLEQWLDYCFDPRILTDIPNECGLPNLPGFKDHRHDQSILTNLALREKILPNNIFKNHGVFNVP